MRLKGGDPFVFGRGGEEVAALRDAGIEVEVVPGLTSGLAVPAVVGIPVTHRDMAHGVALVTGHAADGATEPDWTALVKSGLTLVIYMGVTRVAELAAKLRDAGMAASRPVALIAHGTRPEQNAVTTTLANMAEAARERGDRKSGDHRRRRRGGPRRDAARGRRGGSGRLAHRRGRRPHVMQHVEQRADLRVVLALREVDELQRGLEARAFP